MANDIFTYREPGFESAYWNSMSAVLTRLDLEVPINTMTEEKSAALCQLTRLEHLMLSSEVVLAFSPTICEMADMETTERGYSCLYDALLVHAEAVAISCCILGLDCGQKGLR